MEHRQRAEGSVPPRAAFGSGGIAPPESVSGSVGYTAWASRYMHEFDVPRKSLGYVAVNDRTNAMANPGAAMRAPLTMEDYLLGPDDQVPLCLYDMDVAVDGGDAFIITTAERARDLPCRRSWSTPSSSG